jgi:hypothetical protein
MQEAPVASMLVAATTERSTETQLSKARVLLVLARRSLPSLIEATVAPAVIFYVCLVFIGPGVGMLAVLAWSYGALARRLVFGRRIPAILLLAILGLTVRTVLGILSGTFIYFLQPVIVSRLASDFCPLSPEIASRPAIVRLFSGLTMLWAGVHFLTAAATFALLMSLPTTTFVLLKTLVSLGITVSAIVVTVSWSIRTARAEDLVLGSM